LKALAGYQRLEDSRNRSKIWLNLSLLYRDQGQYSDALHAAEEALHIQISLKNLKKLAEIEGTIGTIHEKKGEFSKALTHLKKARAYFEKTGGSQEIHIVDLRIQMLEDQMP
ncbi:MAG: tetratricopeptide repeat protein, partial [Nitrospirota bacterium]|nr:tetratricopeptide repeat protein [Nitrospirota bacterium]